jgi:hypothetical protein
VANTYTVTPNLVAGNLTVTGNLMVQGDEMRLGLVAPYVRVVKLLPNNGGFTVNLQKDYATRDDVTKMAYALTYGTVAPGNLAPRLGNVAGAISLTAERIVVATDTTIHNGTGAGGDLAVLNRTIRGNMLGASSMLLLTAWGYAITVASGGVQFYGNFGGTAFPQPTIPASVSTLFELRWLITNVNAQNVQRILVLASGSSVVMPTAGAAGAADTSLDQSLVLNAHFLQPGDSAAVLGIEAAVLNSFGPV